jgi:hypothetical protein
MQQRHQEVETVEAQHPGYSTDEYREIVRRAQHIRGRRRARSRRRCLWKVPRTSRPRRRIVRFD